MLAPAMQFAADSPNQGQAVEYLPWLTSGVVCSRRSRRTRGRQSAAVVAAAEVHRAWRTGRVGADAGLGPPGTERLCLRRRHRARLPSRSRSPAGGDHQPAGLQRHHRPDPRPCFPPSDPRHDPRGGRRHRRRIRPSRDRHAGRASQPGHGRASPQPALFEGHGRHAKPVQHGTEQPRRRGVLVGIQRLDPRHSRPRPHRTGRPSRGADHADAAGPGRAGQASRRPGRPAGSPGTAPSSTSATAVQETP